MNTRRRCKGTPKPVPSRRKRRGESRGSRVGGRRGVSRVVEGFFFESSSSEFLKNPLGIKSPGDFRRSSLAWEKNPRFSNFRESQTVARLGSRAESVVYARSGPSIRDRRRKRLKNGGKPAASGARADGRGGSRRASPSRARLRRVGSIATRRVASKRYAPGRSTTRYAQR
jgi:hypothetical protein